MKASAVFVVLCALALSLPLMQARTVTACLYNSKDCSGKEHCASAEDIPGEAPSDQVDKMCSGECVSGLPGWAGNSMQASCSLSGGAIAGIIIGCVVGVALIVVGILFATKCAAPAPFVGLNQGLS